VHDNSTLNAEVTPSSLIIHERRADYPPADYRFEGLAKDVYLATDGVHSDCGVFESVVACHPEETVTLEQVQNILGDFVERDLMLREGNSYLCLAVLPLTYDGNEMVGTDPVDLCRPAQLSHQPSLITLTELASRSQIA
jgi:hypothetical protein